MAQSTQCATWQLALCSERRASELFMLAHSGCGNQKKVSWVHSGCGKQISNLGALGEAMAPRRLSGVGSAAETRARRQRHARRSARQQPRDARGGDGGAAPIASAEGLSKMSVELCANAKWHAWGQSAPRVQLAACVIATRSARALSVLMGLGPHRLLLLLASPWLLMDDVEGVAGTIGSMGAAVVDLSPLSLLLTLPSSSLPSVLSVEL